MDTAAAPLVSDWQYLDTGLPAGHRVCAIGDIHGCSAQFLSLLDRFENSCPRHDHSTLVLTGDFTDRGPDSLGALDAAAGAAQRSFCRFVPLMGNHEQMMRLALLGGPEHDHELWLMNGGVSVLRELEMPESILAEPADVFAREVAASLGAVRRLFLDGLFHHQIVGNLLFVHAGTNPLAKLETHLAQPWHLPTDYHWAWIRHPFLSTPNPLKGLTVVHGHTPLLSYGSQDTQMRRLMNHSLRGGKINLDAGSFISGSVAAAEFIKGKYRILIQPGEET